MSGAVVGGGGAPVLLGCMSLYISMVILSNNCWSSRSTSGVVRWLASKASIRVG